MTPADISPDTDLSPTQRSDFPKVAVLGLGLMGGSFIGALERRFPETASVGFDSDPEAAAQALELGLVDRLASSAQEAVAEADLVVLAMHVRGILETIPQVATMMRDDAVLLDLGSTKTAIVRALDQIPERLQAIGGHPMCGKRTSGVDGASADMYRGRVFVLTPSRRTRPETLERLLNLLRALEMRPVVLEPEHHDQVVAYISHLPHFLPIPLLNATDAAGDSKTWELAAGGFRAAAGGLDSNPAMWEDILLTNRAAVAQALRALRAQADRGVELLESGNDDDLLRWFRDAQELYQQRLG